MKLSAVILAGGESRRMGRDKAWLKLDGQALIVRALSTIRDSGIEEIFISGRAGTDYSSLHCPVLTDREPGSGPLAGIERALEAANAPLLLVLAVDLPNMTATFLLELAGQCGPLTGAIPALRGQLEPLAAIYPKHCRAIALDCLLNGRRAVRHFADCCLREHAVRTFAISPAEFGCFDNWNNVSDVTASGLNPDIP